MDVKDERLAARIRELLAGTTGLEEKRMFGGVGFLVHGNLACGINQGGLIVRLAPEDHARALGRAHVKPFDMRGRPMKGWIVVEPEGYAQARALREWVRRGVEFAQSLPAK